MKFKSTNVKDDVIWIGVNDRKIEKWESHIRMGIQLEWLKF